MKQVDIFGISYVKIGNNTINIQDDKIEVIGEDIKMQEWRPKKEDAQIKSIIGIPSPEQTMSSCVVPLDEELYFALKKHSANNGKIPLRTMCYNIIRDYAIKEKLIQE